MKQLYANNAKTTLVAAIGSTDIVFSVVDGSLFPTPGSNQYFLVTFEVGTQVEIARVYSKIGNTFYANLASNDRGVEGTTPAAFPSGTRVECRITRDALNRFSTSFQQSPDVNQLVAPSQSLNDGYVCNSYDSFGNPAVVIRKDDNTWRFLNFTSVSAFSVASATTTQVTVTSTGFSSIAVGNYLIHFTSGALTGNIRTISAITSTTISWVTPLTAAPAASDTFEILQSNAAILSAASSTGDDAVIMPLILGGTI